MTHSYPVDQAQLRTLTQAGIDLYRELNERDELKLAELRERRVVLQAEIRSVDDVMTDLHETIGRREKKMRGDVIGVIPPDGHLHTAQGDQVEHAQVFGGPQTGQFAARPTRAPFEPGLPERKEAAFDRFQSVIDPKPEAEL